MKSRNILLMMIFCLSANFAQAQKELVVLHTNDTHSRIMPLSNTLADTMVAGRGGFIRRIAMLNEERKKSPDLLLFDSGDFSQGSSYYTLYKGDVEVGLMNQMNYDAGTLGNHEFDFGLENLARIVSKFKIPIVCANYKFSEYGLDKLVKPYVILKRKGVRIGVFGLGPALKGLVDQKNYGQTQYLDPIKAAQETVEKLRKKKCDIIICLSHLGWLEKGTDDHKLIAQTRGIDLVLGGHSHTYFTELRYVNNLDGKPVAVDQNGGQALFIGKMKIEVKPAKR